MSAREIHRGEQVVVFHSASQPAAERARVIAVRDDARLRVEFSDGHRGTCDPWEISSLDAPDA
jgi:hypothetical protein